MTLAGFLVSFTSFAAFDTRDTFDKDYITAIDAYNGNNFDLAVKLLPLWADKGSSEAQYALARMYENGWGVSKNQSKSDALYRKAAKQGHKAAQMRVQHLASVTPENTGIAPAPKPARIVAVSVPPTSEPTYYSPTYSNSAPSPPTDAPTLGYSAPDPPRAPVAQSKQQQPPMQRAIEAGYGGLLSGAFLGALAAIIAFIWFGAKKAFTAVSNSESIRGAGRFVKETTSVISDSLSTPEYNAQTYSQALQEIESGTTDRGLWAKALVSANGDEGKARAAYIKYRVKALTSG